MLCIPSAPRIQKWSWLLQGCPAIRSGRPFRDSSHQEHLKSKIKSDIWKCMWAMGREMGTERIGRGCLFSFFSGVFRFKDSEGVSLALSQLLQHTREWMKQLSHLNTHSGNPPLSTMPGQNRKSINTYNAFYLFSILCPFTKSSICEAESGATCHQRLFVVQQLLRKEVWAMIWFGRWVFEDATITTFQGDWRSVPKWNHKHYLQKQKAPSWWPCLLPSSRFTFKSGSPFLHPETDLWVMLITRIH